MRLSLFLGAALLASAAQAADLPSRVQTPPSPVRAPSWEGLYAGLHTGWQWDSHKWTMRGYGEQSESRYQLRLNSSAPVFGAHAGYNFQSGTLVYGVEADADFHNGSDSRSVSLKTSTARIGTQASLRVRGGLDLGNALVYLTGGLAMADISHRTGCVPNYGWCTPAVDTGDIGGMRFGWTVGAGGEWSLNRDWSLRAEYRYANYGTMRNDTSAFWSNVDENPRNYRDSLATQSQTVRIGVTYHFPTR